MDKQLRWRATWMTSSMEAQTSHPKFTQVSQPGEKGERERERQRKRDIKYNFDCVMGHTRRRTKVGWLAGCLPDC